MISRPEDLRHPQPSFSSSFSSSSSSSSLATPSAHEPKSVTLSHPSPFQEPRHSYARASTTLSHLPSSVLSLVLCQRERIDAALQPHSGLRTRNADVRDTTPTILSIFYRVYRFFLGRDCSLRRLLGISNSSLSSARRYRHCLTYNSVRVGDWNETKREIFTVTFLSYGTGD